MGRSHGPGRKGNNRRPDNGQTNTNAAGIELGEDTRSSSTPPARDSRHSQDGENMTLALYGKSRRRQGGLLLAGVVAVLVAMLAGVATFTDAFAHSASISKSVTCANDTWSVDWKLTGDYPSKRLVIHSWSVTGGGSTSAITPSPIPVGTNPQQATSSTTGIPASVSEVTATAQIYWDNGSGGNRYPSSGYVTETKTAKWSDSCAKIIVKKVIESGNANTPFYVTLDNKSSGDEGSGSGLQFNPTALVRFVDFDSGDDDDDFDFTEAAVAGWNVTGWKILQDPSEKSCPAANAQFGSQDNKWQSGSNGQYTTGQVNVDKGKTVTVCFRNAGPPDVNIQIHKYLPKANDNNPWENQGSGQGDWKYTIYADNGGAPGAVLHSNIDHLNPSPSFPKQTVWIKETDTDGDAFYGWFVPDGDNNSGNDKCNQSPANFTTGNPDNRYSTAEYLKIDASFFDTTGNQTGLFHICAYNKPRVYDPGIQKVAANPSYSGGYAQWLIKVDNTANTQAVDVKIQDSGVVNNGAVTGGTCSDGDISDGEMLCSVNAGATLVVPVKKAVSQQCRAGEASNSATISWKVPGSNEYTSLGTVGPVVVTIPANTELCDKPGITKEANTTSTTDPSAVKWTVTVTNPASGTGTTQTVYIKDTGVNVVSGPTYTGSANCTIPGGSSFEQELTSANGVQCSMPNNSTISFVVKPAGTISRACPDKLYNNTAYLYIGSTTNTPLTAQGAEITLQGNPELCTRDLEICKVVVGNGDGYIESGTFNFDVREAGAGPNIFNGVGGLSAAEPNPDTANSDGTEVCVTKQVPTTKNIEVVEWSSRPVGWVGDASGYPQYSINGGTRTSNNTTSSIAAGSSSVKVTFYNKTLPRTREIEIEKYFVGTGNYVAGAGDVPTFTLNDPDYPAVTFESACVPLANGMNNHLAWTCTVPWNWDGTVTETPAPGWEQVAVAGPDLRCEPPLSRIEALVALVQRLTTLGEGDTLKSSWKFCNRPYAEVKVQKVFVGDFASYPAFTFQSNLPGGAGDAGPAANTTVTVYDEAIDLGTYNVQEDQFLSQQEGCFGDTAAGYYTEVSVAKNGSAIVAKHEAGSASIPATAPGDQVTVTFYNTRCELAASPIVIIEKFADPAGNRSGTTSISGFQIAVFVDGVQLDGDLDAPGIQPFTSKGEQIVIAGLNPATVTAVEVNPNTGGWKFTGSKTDLGDDGSFEKSVATQPAAETITYDDVVRFNFYNQPRVNIEVNKTEISLATPAGGPGAGWSFTLTGCNITPQVAVTGANGKATFSDLPPAVGCTYTVTETVKSGWSAINPVQVTAPTAAGQTAVLSFTNVKIEVCTNCVTIVTPTPTTPTATATPKPSETPTSPTATPETPTQKPTEEATAGARTPGPGQTPIAPSTGNGLLGSGPAGVNMLLALVGLLAISLGTTILALGRKSSRR